LDFPGAFPLGAAGFLGEAELFAAAVFGVGFRF
jgi:hypothetical protein